MYNKFENTTTRREKETFVHYLSAMVSFVCDKMLWLMKKKRISYLFILCPFLSPSLTFQAIIRKAKFAV